MTEEEKLEQALDTDAELDDNVAPAAEATAEPETDIHKLLEDARAKADDHWDQLLRTRAELDNMQRRAQRDVENAHKYALEKFVQELLPVLDSMELGLAAIQSDSDEVTRFREGSELTLRMLFSAVEKFGVEIVNPVGEKFDPAQHQAMSMQEVADKEPNTVMAVVQKGYTLNDRLLRPAMVIVSKAAAAPPDDTRIDERA